MSANSKSEDWIVQAERQSWEAELIVSVLAIYSTIQLETFLDKWSSSIVFKYSDQTLVFLEFVFLYLYAMQNILLLGFVLHFCIRVIWIGFLGLNSVYPNGINTSSTVYPQHVLKKLKKDYPDLRSFILQLDQLASLIFSILCMVTMAFLASAIWVFVLLIFNAFLQHIFPYGLVKFFQIFFVVSLYAYCVAFVLLLNYGPFVQSKWSKKYGYPLLTYGNSTILSILAKPFSYINYTLRTNISTKHFLLIAFGIFNLSILSPVHDAKLQHFNSRSFARMNNFAEDINPDNFKDSAEGDYYFRPFIQSSVISQNYLKITLPFFEREREFRIELCGSLSISSECTPNEKRLALNAFNRACSKKYYSLYLNDASISDVNWSRKRIGKSHQWGYETIIPIESLKPGHHVLKILLAYSPDNQAETTRIIPFYKSQ